MLDVMLLCGNILEDNMIPVMFTLPEEETLENYIKIAKNDMPWLNFLVENSLSYNIAESVKDQVLLYDIITVCFHLTPEKETFYYLAYRQEDNYNIRIKGI